MSTKNLSINYIVAIIMSLKQKISTKTLDFYRLLKEFNKYLEEKAEFEIRNREYIDAPLQKRIGWFLVLFLVVPTLILVDYASLKLFIEFLKYKVDGAVLALLNVFGLFIFFILEIGIALAVLKLNEILESNNKFSLRLLRNFLMFVMITLPSLLILAGYLLNPTGGAGGFVKTAALILLSIIIHIAFFVLMNDILKAIGFIIYKISNLRLKSRNPESKIEAVKLSLHPLYNQYDTEILKLSDLPDASKYEKTIGLSKRELFLKERLEDDIDDNDYDEFIDTKRFAPKPPKPVGSFSTCTSTSTTVW
jgi:hypothetical protein